MEKKLLIGSHVSMNSPEFYLGSVKEALSYGSTTFMFYTGAPQNSIRKPLNELKIQQGRELIKANNIDENKIVVHAPYIINPASDLKPDIYDLTIKTIINELQRTAGFGAKILVLHPGNHLNMGVEYGIDTLVKTLNKVFSIDGTDVKIAVETMAGKGSEIGFKFEQIKEILDKCEYKDRLGVCLDTCHISDAGYDLSDVDALINEFDRVVGLDKLLVVHLNDSKNPTAAHKDRHENIGYGFIGFDILNKIANHEKLADIPKILETPYINEKPPYKAEISMLKSGKYIDNWKENL